MTLVAGVLAGFLAARLLWVLLRPVLVQPALLRHNWRDREVPTAVGVVVPLAVVLVECGRVVAGAVGDGSGQVTAARTAVVVAMLGLGLAGLLDDLAGGDDARGFRGHLGELARGRLTTGGVKVFGGAAVALVAVAVAAPGAGAGAGAPRLLADAALVALAANLGNLLDRRPGRATKAGLVAFAVLAVATQAASVLTGVAVVAGAAAALLLDDLRERLMLGDSGANALGGAVGLGVVLACAPGTRTAVLLVVAALNVLSEAVSFTRVIDAVPPLRALDRWGRRA